MKTVSKSLGEFIASVLSAISGATYIPAAAVVGGVSLVGVYEASGKASPIEAISGSTPPTFPELAVLLVVIAIVAAILEPIQMAVTRVFEGQSELFPFAKSVSKHQERRAKLHKERDEAIERKGQLLDQLNHGEGGCSETQVEIDLANCRARIGKLSESCKAYPDSPQRVLGTKLGNAVRYYEDTANAELAGAQQRGVGIPSCPELQDFLPVAYFAVPEETRQQHEAARSQLNLNTTMLVVLPVVALAFAISIWNDTDRWFFWQVGNAVSFGAAWLAARQAALWAARAYGSMLLAIARQFAAGGFSIIDEAEAKTGIALAKSA